MTDTPDTPARVEGQLTPQCCIQCGEPKVVLVYQRFAHRVLVCLGCEHAWADEPVDGKLTGES